MPRLLIACGIIVLSAIAGCLLCDVPVFETNDDVSMMIIAAGAGSNEGPDDHLLFSHFLIGKALAFLYGAFPRIPWYGIYLSLIQLFSLACIALILARNSSNKALFMITIFIWCFIGFRYFHIMQFTATASLAATCAALLLADGIERNREAGQKYFSSGKIIATIIFPVVIFSVSSLVRIQASLMCLFLAGIYLVTRYVSRKQWHSLAVAAAALFISFLSIQSLEYWKQAYFQANGWQESRTINSYRAKLTEFGRLEIDSLSKAQIQTIKEVGWDLTDLQMLNSFGLLDKEVFNLENLAYIEKKLPRIPLDRKPETVISRLAEIPKDITFLPCILSLALMCILVFTTKKTRENTSEINYWGDFLFLAGVFVFLAMMAYAFKLPQRIYCPVIQLSVLMLCFSARKKIIRALERTSNKLLTVSALIIFVFYAFYLYNALRPQALAIAIKGKQLEYRLINNLEENTRLITWGGAFPHQLIKPFDNIYDYFSGIKIAHIGANPYTPTLMRTFAGWGITKPLAELDSPGLLLGSTADLNKVIEKFASRHYGKKPVFTPVLIDESIPLELYRVHYVKPDPLIVNDDSADCPDIQVEDLILSNGPEAWKLINCRLVHEDKLQYIESKGKESIISLRKQLDIDLADYEYFVLEIAIDNNAPGNCQALIHFSTSETEGFSFAIPLSSDSRMHRYVYPLRRSINIEEPDQYKLLHLSMIPVAHEGKSSQILVELGRVGLLKKKSRLE